MLLLAPLRGSLNLSQVFSNLLCEGEKAFNVFLQS